MNTDSSQEQHIADEFDHATHEEAQETIKPMEKAPSKAAAEIKRIDDMHFADNIEKLLQYGEDMRLSAMKQQRTRGFIATTVGLISVVIGASGFGWYLLVEVMIARALGCILLGIVAAIGVYIWSTGSIRSYKKDYKKKFLPRLAKILGGFDYFEKRGINRQLLAKTGIVPAHEVYNAEDCFIGAYKGVNVMFSEARLGYKNKHLDAVFNGLFVLLETSSPLFKGHTIVTADKDMVKRNAGKRWKALQTVNIRVENPAWDRFVTVSNKPELAQKFVNDRLLKELSEASDIFDDSALSAVFFREKYIFLMIPYDGDMFEASDIHVPITTKRHAMRCKKEIEKILEVIDVFDLYDTKQENEVSA